MGAQEPRPTANDTVDFRGSEVAQEVAHHTTPATNVRERTNATQEAAVPTATIDVETKQGNTTQQEDDLTAPAAANDAEERASVRSDMLMGQEEEEEEEATGLLNTAVAVVSVHQSSSLLIAPHHSDSSLGRMETWKEMEQEDGSAGTRALEWDADASSTNSTATVEPPAVTASTKDPPDVCIARDDTAPSAEKGASLSAQALTSDDVGVAEYHRLLLEWVRLQEGVGPASPVATNGDGDGVDPMKKEDAFGGTKEMEEVEKDFAQALRGDAGGSTATPPTRPADYLESHGTWLRVMNRQRTCYLYVHTFTQLQRSTRPDGAGP